MSALLEFKEILGENVKTESKMCDGPSLMVNKIRLGRYKTLRLR